MRVYLYNTAIVTDVHDGDTFRADVQLDDSARSARDLDLGLNIHLRPDGLWLIDQSIRLLGCNAPEIATEQGKKSRDYLASILKPGTKLRLISHNWDKYGGRIDCKVTLPDGRDLTKTMIAGGQAVPWSGLGPKPTN